MKIRKRIVGAAALMLGTCLTTLGVGPSIASAGPGRTSAASSAEHIIRPPQARADATDLARSSAAVAAAMAKHAKEVRAAAERARARKRVESMRRAAGGAYHETVWTSGFQAQINACRGAVNVSAHYHVAAIAEAWQCGGSRFPRAGALVMLSGVFSGLYRVGPVVAVLNAYVDKTSDIPRGYPLLYQTCRYGNAHTETFTELIPVR